MSLVVLPYNLTNGTTADASQVQGNDNAVVNVINGHIDDQNLDLANIKSLLQLAVTGTRRKVAFGTQALTWTGGNQATIATVTHGLGATPVVVDPTVAWSGSGQSAFPGYGNLTATTFDLTAWSINAFTGTLSVGWVAIG